MKHLTILVILSIAILNSIYAQSIDVNRPVKLTPVSREKFSLIDIKSNKASVFIFLSPECPICIKMTGSIREIADSFASKGVKFYLIFPGKYFTASQIQTFQKTYKLDIPALRDENNEFVALTGATITPQAFVVDHTGKIVYTGKIDNWYESIGKRRTVITEFYLRDALDAVINSRLPKIKRTEPVGCIIER